MIPTSLSTSASSKAGGDYFGNAFGTGEWNINLAGSGQAMQSGGMSLTTIALIAAAGVAAWLILRRR